MYVVLVGATLVGHCGLQHQLAAALFKNSTWYTCMYDHRT